MKLYFVSLIPLVCIPACSAANDQYARDLQGCIDRAHTAEVGKQRVAYNQCADALDQKDAGVK